VANIKLYQSTTEHGEKYVNMSNALANAGHGLSLTEKRLVMMAISKLDSVKATATDVNYSTVIHAREYAEAFEVEINTAYDQLQSSAKNLYERSISFFVPAYNRKGDPIKPSIKKMRWVGSIKYNENEGSVQLNWWREIVPHLFNLKKQFTSYQLKQATALRCSYSWRLLEMLMRFKSTGLAKFSIEDFCQSMDATETQKKNFSNIRRHIIEPAVKELNNKDGWIITWEPVKKGRRVAELHFTFMKDPQGRLF
jgi:plasmid replication initiation protein